MAENYTKETVPDTSTELSHRSRESDPDTHVARGYPSHASEEPTTLERYITLKPVVAFGLTLQASWEAISVTFATVLADGGPASLVYGMIIVTIGSSCTAATLGEMASVDPAVGAQYRWAARYAPKALNPHFFGFIQGWLTCIAWLASATTSPYALATYLIGLVQFNYPTYESKRWHLTLVAWAAIILPVIWNLVARRILVALEISGGLLHVALFIAVVVILGVLLPQSSNEFVWNNIIKKGAASETEFGWNNSGVAFCVGLLIPAFAVGGFDGIIHMSDETRKAHKRIPKAMVLTVLINGLLGWGFILALCYTLEAPLNSGALFNTTTTVYFIQMIYLATKSQAATNAVISLIICIIVVSNFTIYASLSRLAWAFARDGGLPFSRFFGQVHPYFKIPVNALILVSTCSCLLLLINIGSSTAFLAVVSLAVLALFISYLAPIVFLLIRKWNGDPPRGPWQLGRFGWVINLFSLCYCIFMIVFIPFPLLFPISADNFNYASAVWAGVMIFAILDYVTFGKKRFKLKA